MKYFQGGLALAALFCLWVSLPSCSTVKEYQKNKLNDSEMVLGNRKIQKTELNFQSYRIESSTPAFRVYLLLKNLKL